MSTSTRPNLISTIAGLALIPIFYTGLFYLGFWWVLLAFGISCVVEMTYLARFVSRSSKLFFILAGNIVSCGVLMVIAPVAMMLCEPLLAWETLILQLEMPVGMTAFAISLLILAGSFVIRTHPVTVDVPSSEPVPDADSMP